MHALLILFHLASISVFMGAQFSLLPFRTRIGKTCLNWMADVLSIDFTFSTQSWPLSSLPPNHYSQNKMSAFCHRLWKVLHILRFPGVESRSMKVTGFLSDFLAC